MKKPALLLGAATAVLTLSTAAAVAGGAAAASAATTHGSIKQMDYDAAGYQVHPASGGATAFRYAQASFTVPTAAPGSCSDGADTSLTAGLGSYILGHTAEQAGVFFHCNPKGGPTYQAGYVPGAFSGDAYLPDGAFTVRPGDAIFASVYYNAASKVYTYTVQDQTSGQQDKVTAACAAGATCTTGSAEVLANSPEEEFLSFSKVAFSDVQVTDSAGQRGGLTSSDWGLYQVIDASPDQNPPTGITSPVTSGGQSSFSVYYQG